MNPRNETRRRRPPGGVAGAEAGPTTPVAAPARKLQWKQIVITALITGAGFYVGSRLMKSATEKDTDEGASFDAQRAMLLGQSGAAIPAPMGGGMYPMMLAHQNPASIQAAPDGKMIMITPEALARLQAGR